MQRMRKQSPALTARRLQSWLRLQCLLAHPTHSPVIMLHLATTAAMLKLLRALQLKAHVKRPKMHIKPLLQRSDSLASILAFHLKDARARSTFLLSTAWHLNNRPGKSDMTTSQQRQKRTVPVQAAILLSYTLLHRVLLVIKRYGDKHTTHLLWPSRLDQQDLLRSAVPLPRR